MSKESLEDDEYKEAIEVLKAGPVGSLGDYPDPTWTPAQQFTWDKQTALTLAYTTQGNMSAACRTSDIPYNTANTWLRENRLGFKDRIKEAQTVFNEYLESKALERIESPKVGQGTDALLTRLLEANYPEKWGRKAENPDDTAKSLVAEVRKMTRSRKTAVDGSETVEETLEFKG